LRKKEGQPLIVQGKKKERGTAADCSGKEKGKKKGQPLIVHVDFFGLPGLFAGVQPIDFIVRLIQVSLPNGAC
jgi:hypothetical protein